MRCIVDANILIDLSRGQLLQACFALPHAFQPSPFILREIHPQDRDPLIQLGLTVQALEDDGYQSLLAMQQTSSPLSLGDWSALILAEATGSTLLTGDGALRKQAQQRGLPVHGVLWVLDELAMNGIADPSSLHDSLVRMLEAGARLPWKACLTRLQHWSSPS